MAILNSVISLPIPNMKVYDITIASDISTAGYYTLILEDNILKSYRSLATAHCFIIHEGTVNSSGGVQCYVGSYQANYKNDLTSNHSGFSIRVATNGAARNGWSYNTVSGLDAGYTGTINTGIIQIDSNGTLKICCDGTYKILAGDYRVIFMW